MDWGLAKVLPRGGVGRRRRGRQGRRHDETVIATARSGSDDSDLSHAGSVLGTPSLHGRPSRPGARSTGSTSGPTSSRWARSSARSSPASRRSSAGPRARSSARRRWATRPTPWPGSTPCGADADLVALAKDCLAREPEDRPRDAGAVAGRVTAYLAGVQERLRRAELRAASRSGPGGG